MKIRGRDEVTPNEAVSVDRKTRSAERSGDAIQSNAAVARKFGEGSVRLELSRSIQEELDPAKIEAERQAHFEDVRRRVQENRYEIDTSKVAPTVATDIAIEIALARQTRDEE